MRPFVLACVILAAACGGDGDGGDNGGDGDGGGTCEEEDPRPGIATYYDADGSGNCTFDPTPENLMVAAMNDPEWKGSQVCGGCAAVSGPLGDVVVRIVDRCPECEAGHLDLSAEAFAMIADPIDGRVDIEWRFVPCEVDGPITYLSDSGSNDFYLAVQIRNHRVRVAMLEGRATGDGAYVDMPRAEYNRFIAMTGFGPGPFDFRVADINGTILEDTAVALPHGGTAEGSGQFPACPP